MSLILDLVIQSKNQALRSHLISLFVWISSLTATLPREPPGQPPDQEGVRHFEDILQCNLSELTKYELAKLNNFQIGYLKICFYLRKLI